MDEEETMNMSAGINYSSAVLRLYALARIFWLMSLSPPGFYWLTIS